MLSRVIFVSSKQLSRAEFTQSTFFINSEYGMTNKNLHDFDYVIDEEERALLEAVEKEGIKSAGDASQRMKLAREAALNTISQKRKAITIRLPERDLLRLKAQALRDGLPYQTLISSVLHKYIEGRDPRS
jgi:predicted DNA binding CopG/RHH family protein